MTRTMMGKGRSVLWIRINVPFNEEGDIGEQHMVCGDWSEANSLSISKSVSGIPRLLFSKDSHVPGHEVAGRGYEYSTSIRFASLCEQRNGTSPSCWSLR